MKKGSQTSFYKVHWSLILDQEDPGMRAHKHQERIPDDLPCHGQLSGVRRTTSTYIGEIYPTFWLLYYRHVNHGRMECPAYQVHQGSSRISILAEIKNKEQGNKNRSRFINRFVCYMQAGLFFWDNFSNQKEFTRYYKTQTAKFMMVGVCSDYKSRFVSQIPLGCIKKTIGSLGERER